MGDTVRVSTAKGVTEEVGVPPAGCEGELLPESLAAPEVPPGEKLCVNDSLPVVATPLRVPEGEPDKVDSPEEVGSRERVGGPEPLSAPIVGKGLEVWEKEGEGEDDRDASTVVANGEEKEETNKDGDPDTLKVTCPTMTAGVGV